METRRDLGPISPRLIFGLAIMAWGLLLTLDNFGLIDAHQYWRLWPLVLIAVGLARLAESVRIAAFAVGRGLVLVGLAFLLHNLDVVRLPQVWPLILFVVGGGIVWKALGPRARPRRAATWCRCAGGQPARCVHLHGRHRARDEQPGLQGGDGHGGDGRVRDRPAPGVPGGRTAVFDIFAMWGGVEIRVPEDWAVESHVVPLLGGFEDKTRQPADAKQRLVITGIAIMGGVGVKN